MRLGVIARCEDRGLGYQSLDACRHLHPERVLLIDPGHDKRFVSHWDWYDPWDVTQVRWTSGRLDEATVCRWLDGLDVVYTAESVYDDRLPRWAAQAGVGVVVHANPEFLSARDAGMPVTWWVATPWRLDHLPARTRVVPMPTPEPPYRHKPTGDLRFLHIAGWPAVADRNGTNDVAEAAARIAAELVIRGQHPNIIRYRLDRNVTVEAGNVTDRWDLYRDADVLVMPRRFGGLCLPVIEALAVGLPVVMSDVSPNEVWPGPRVPAREGQTVATRAGLIPLYDTDPVALAECLNELDAEIVGKLHQEAREWAEANSWDALRPLWQDELARACW